MSWCHVTMYQTLGLRDVLEEFVEGFVVFHIRLYPIWTPPIQTLLFYGVGPGGRERDVLLFSSSEFTMSGPHA